MELPISQLGQILKGLYESGYFEEEGLRQGIEQLINENQLTIGISIQEKVGDELMFGRVNEKGDRL
ncbi:hypothetical protein [uncultured Vagococcus sp.]|uniref:hypothetical protein n=1 Tax=uncultured Vagococcus sp. TaxID=189676 RepID=UPI0028D81D2D|nr:hypothetical protein [uncultured Vagococcus sp.]